MAACTEVVKIEGGRVVTIQFQEDEIKHVITVGVNFLLREGLMTLSGTDDVTKETEVIGTEQALSEAAEVLEQSKKATKQ